MNRDADNRRKNTTLQQEAQELLRSPDYFPQFLTAMRESELVGEERGACVIHLTAISAATKRPWNVIAKGSSSSGKNFLVSRVLRLCPPEVVHEITSSSDTAWNYAAKEFRNSIVYLQERNDAAGAVHPVRLLISEGRLVRIVTANEGGKRVTKRFVTEGPIASISTTTRDRIEIDDETRHVSVWVDQSQDQTKRILKSYLSQTESMTEREVEVWREAYRAVAKRATTLPVEIPGWFEVVAEKVYARDVAARRYFPAFVNACKTVALVHSFQAGREASPTSIRIDFADLAVASILFGPVLVESLHRKNDRNSETRRAVGEILERGGDPVTCQGLAKYLDVSDDRAYARLRKAFEAGTIIRANEPEKGNVKRYLPAPVPNFVPEPETVLANVPEIKKPVRLVHPLTGKQLKLTG